MQAANDVWTKLWEMGELAKLVIGPNGKPWPTKRMRQYLQRCGAAEKRGGRWVVTTQKLIVHFPEVWQVMSAQRLSEHTHPEFARCLHAQGTPNSEGRTLRPRQ